MAFSSRARKKGSAEEDELDITPMIDMTFLLLIFFMVTSTMETPEALAIPESKWGQGIESDDAVVLTIDIIDETPSVYLSDKIEGSPVSLPEVTAYVQSRISPSRNIIILKADRDVPAGFVQDVARAANEVTVDYELIYYTAVDYKK